MNFTALLLFAMTILMHNCALPFISSGKKISFYYCKAWKKEFFTSCYMAVCEKTCDNPRGSCPNDFYPIAENCRPGCVCASGFVRDENGICTAENLACKFRDLAASFSRDPYWSDPLTSGRRKNRRRNL